MKLFIQEARERAGYSQKELADIVGVAANTFHGYESGKHDPKSDMLIKIAKACDVTVDFLLGYTPENKKSPGLSTEAMKLAADYEVLDGWGKRTVRAVTDSELARVREPADNIVELKPAGKVLPLLGSSFAAGAGEPDLGNFWEDYEVPADSPADFAIRISGDSMEPWIPDGSIQLCRRATPRDGEVGAFLIDGEFLCKQVCMDMTGTLHLFSLNRDRKDKDRHIPRDEIERQVMCFGTVILDKRLPLPLD